MSHNIRSLLPLNGQSTSGSLIFQTLMFQKGVEFGQVPLLNTDRRAYTLYMGNLNVSYLTFSNAEVSNLSVIFSVVIPNTVVIQTIKVYGRLGVEIYSVTEYFRWVLLFSNLIPGIFLHT